VRVEIQDWNGHGYTISSRNPALVGEWFAEQAAHLMTADSRMQIRIQIWPQDADEAKLIGAQSLSSPMTQDGLLHLADCILTAAARAGELESAPATICDRGHPIRPDGTHVRLNDFSQHSQTAGAI
jgi:hypothetical protein